MKDRTPRYPNRIKITHADGTVERVIWERDDDPVEPGTPLNKSTLLTNETGEMLGLDESGTVNDALQRILLTAVSETSARSELDDFEMQVGTQTINGSTVIAFSRQFPGVPIVIVFIPGGTALLAATNITAAGFTVSASNKTINYVAIYYGGAAT